MADFFHQWIFFFAVAGSIIFFAVRFSRLARRHGKNRWVFGFVGAACVPSFVRILKLIADTLKIDLYGYAPSYLVLFLSILFSLGVSVLLQRVWGKKS